MSAGVHICERQFAIMKKLIWFFALLILGVAASAQSVTDITGALKRGDADALARYMDQNVEIALPGQEDVVSKSEAAAALRRFFSAHRVKAFSEMHQGRSKGQDSQYVIGNLNTDKGVFRVYVYMKSKNGGLAIQEIRFDKE